VCSCKNPACGHKSPGARNGKTIRSYVGDLCCVRISVRTLHHLSVYDCLSGRRGYRPSYDHDRSKQPSRSTYSRHSVPPQTRHLKIDAGEASRMGCGLATIREIFCGKLSRPQCQSSRKHAPIASGPDDTRRHFERAGEHIQRRTTLTVERTAWAAKVRRAVLSRLAAGETISPSSAVPAAGEAAA
jgi:hypothetical protein